MRRVIFPIGLVSVMTMSSTGCDKPHDAAQAPAPPAASAAQSGTATGGESARPSLSGAKGAAERTVDRVNRYQREVEKESE